MKTLEEMKESINKIEKTMSLNQIARQTGINYITLRHIKFGQSKRVTPRVLETFTKFADEYKPEAAPLKKRTRKSAPAVDAPAAPQVAAVKAPAAPKPAAAVKPAPVVGKKPRGRKKGVKAAKAAPAVEKAMVVKEEATQFFSGDALKEELRRVEAKLIFLRSLEKAEKDYRSALGKK